MLGVGGFTPAAASTLPMVTPVWSETIRRSFGIAVQPQMQRGPYGQAQAWPKYAAELGVAFIRGRYSPTLASNATLITQCRTLGLKWVMTLIPEDWSMTQTELRAALIHLRDKASDLVIAIEGMNEPNHNRDGSPVRSDWATISAAYQKTIWDFVKSTPSLSHVEVISPSLHMGSNEIYSHFTALRDAGIADHIDYAGMHSYPAGLKPDNQVDTRLGYVRDAWGAVPTWVTETGYQNAINAPMSGPRPVPTDVAATYSPRTVLDYFTRGCKTARYELLGEPNPALDEPEAHYGLLHCPSDDPTTWTVKPEFYLLKNFIAGLADTAPTYTPAPVALQVTAPATVKWVLTAKSNGTKTLYAYLNTSIWDIKTRTRITVNPVDVVIVDRAGARTVKIGPGVTAIPIR